MNRGMKRGLILLLAAVMILATGCGSDDGASEGLKLEGFSSSETKAVQKVLDQYGIVVAKSERVIVDDEGDELLAALTAFLHPYDITDEDGTVYRVTVNGNTNTLMTIVNTDTGDIVHSMSESLLTFDDDEE